MRREGDLRFAAPGARADSGRRGAGVRHVVLRPGPAWDLHRLRVDSATPKFRCRTLERDLHSGTYGGVAPNAIETLARMLCQLKSDTGEIRIPGLYEAVVPPTETELATWKRLPFDREGFLRDEVTGKALTGLKDRTVFERVWALPTFEIHGIKGGFVGEGAKTVIPAQATAKVSLRLVPGQDFEEVGRALERAVRAAAPEWAEVRVNLLHGGNPVQVDVSAPAFDVMDQAFESVVGQKGRAGQGGWLHPDHPRTGPHRRAGDPDRYWAAGRRAALSQREAGSVAVVERD